MKGYKIYIMLLACLLLGAVDKTAVANTLMPVFEEQDTMPIPSGIKNMLFYVQRTPNKNTIVYELNLKNGVLNANEPVHIFWLRYAEDGSRKELNFIQRKFAYGLNVKKLSKDNYEMRFLAYNKRPLYLKKAADDNYYVFANILGKQAVLKRIYIKINGGTFWSPNVIYIELKGTDVTTGATVLERIKP
ncbi:MAG TPA: DUF4833 domain-containing protein [Flavipsychrobacter sp.]